MGEVKAAVDRLRWIWCWAAFRLYIALPMAARHTSLYGRFTLWLLGYGGIYAHNATYADYLEMLSLPPHDGGGG